VVGEELGGVGVVVSASQGQGICRQDLRLHFEFAFDPRERRLQGTVVKPIGYSESEEVLAPVRIPLGKVQLLQRLAIQLRQRNGNQSITRQAPVLQGVGTVARLLQIQAQKGIGIGNDNAPGLEVRQVHLESRRVHGHQNVGLIPRSPNVSTAEVDLESAHTRQGPGGRSNLSRKIGEGADVVPKDRRGIGELGSGQLHAVARVPGKSDGCVFDLDDGSGRFVVFFGGYDRHGG
jgi:hypothetical protein